SRDWSSDVCSSDLTAGGAIASSTACACRARCAGAPTCGPRSPRSGSRPTSPTAPPPEEAMSSHQHPQPTAPGGPRPASGRVPLSVLDLAIVPEGSTGQDAVRRAVGLARDLDRLGYHRVWYAEHHLSPGVGSASPAVLAAAVAARTERIRVGSGAVLLSTTSPL